MVIVSRDQTLYEILEQSVAELLLYLIKRLAMNQESVMRIEKNDL